MRRRFEWLRATSRWVVFLRELLSADICYGVVLEKRVAADCLLLISLIDWYESAGPYYTLTTTNWFLQELSVIPRGSWGDVARRFTMIRWFLSDISDMLLRLFILKRIQIPVTVSASIA
ncbi:hypothetical protein F511_33742 [Dorcoceras hygrometricum]|uniref:Uncharacterized protein n=1 Tax=Dorcoceras hygrometricum TaxID=472368 RepID=A0A2Z7BLX6_9LAMI|nr:hypothetical protein F511_33742 [Dorcoceras hygrometricum]